MKRVLLCGATGYLGGFILDELLRQGYQVKVLVRNSSKVMATDSQNLQVFEAEVTDPETITDCCEGIDIVISTLGITRQKDGLTYMDVDYQANVNLLRQAQKAGVKKFIYVSALNAEKLTHLAICKAKELFVEELKISGLQYCVLRPNGFYSDMAEFLTMAKQGRAYLFGKGLCRSNPIHGVDLAKVCVDAIKWTEQEVEVGGPEIFTHEEIAQMAFSAVGKRVKITCIPEWVRKFTLGFLRSFTKSTFHGPIEFFMTVMAMDMVAPKYGNFTLGAFFEHAVKEQEG